MSAPLALAALGAAACRLGVRAQPGARKSGIAGLWNGRLKVALHAPPADGAANAALVELLAQALGVRRSQVALVSGERNRLKEVRIELPEALVRARLEAALAELEG